MLSKGMAGVILIIFLTCIARTAPAQHTVISLKLSEAIKESLTNNDSILLSRLEKTSESADLKLAHRKFTPLLSVDAGIYKNSIENVANFSKSIGPKVTWTLPTGASITYAWELNDAGNGSKNYANDMLSISQPLLRGAGFSNSYASVKIAENQNQILQLQRKNLISSKITDVIFFYRNLQKAKQARIIAEQSLKRAKEFLKITRELIDAGRIPESEYLSVDFDLSSQEQSLDQALLAEFVASSELSALWMAIPTSAQFDPVDEIQAIPVRLGKIEEIISTGLSRNPDYQAMLLQTEQSEIAKRLAKDAQLPEISLQINSTRYKSPLNSRQDKSVGLVLQIPINDFSTERAAVQADVKLQKSLVELKASELRIARSIVSIVRNIEILERQILISERRIVLSKKKIEIELEKFKAGRSSNFQLLSYQEELRLAELSSIDTKINYLNYLTILDNQLGTTLETWGISVEN